LYCRWLPRVRTSVQRKAEQKGETVTDHRRTVSPPSQQATFSAKRRSLYVLGSAVVVVVVTVIAPSAFGVAYTSLGLQNDAAERPNLVPAQAQRLVSIETRGGQHVALWKGLSRQGWRCVFLHITNIPATNAIAAPASPNGGGQCAFGPARVQAQPIQATISWAQQTDGVLALVDGRVSPGRGISRVELETPSGGATALPLQGGYFLGELPAGAATAVGALAAEPLFVVSYNGAGSEVARLDLHELVSNGSPE
jgi:hypothetical protein